MKMKLRQEKIMPYIFIALPVLLIVFLFGYPIFYAAYISAHRWKLLDFYRPFTGLHNYIDLLTDKDFLSALKVTTIFTAAYVLISTVLGLCLSLAIIKIRGTAQTIVKSIYFLPFITSMIAVSITFKFLLRSGAEGVINHYLRYLGIGSIPWLNNARWALIAIVGVTVWKNIGFSMLIFLNGLLAIPDMYYEAAKVDGASAWPMFIHITLPLLKPIIAFLIIIGTILSFQAFNQVFVLTSGGPAGKTRTLGLEIYFRAFQSFDMGSAAAISFVMFLIIMIFTIFQLKYFGRPTNI